VLCGSCGKDALSPVRARVFCASLADVFDNEVPLEWFVELLDLIRLTPNLDWLLLTKRIGRVRNALDIALRDVNVRQAGKELFEWLRNWTGGVAPPNVWLGATIVNQEEADRDISKLLGAPARIRFLSMEPLLGPVDLERPMPGPDLDQGGGTKICQPWMIQSGIDWVIVGGESGSQARPMHPQWVRDICGQCERAGVPFLFKQWGEWKPICQMTETGSLYRSNRTAKEGENQEVLDELYGRTCRVEQLCLRIDGDHAAIASRNAFLAGTSPMHAFKVGKRAAGRHLDGRTHDEFPRGVA